MSEIVMGEMTFDQMLAELEALPSDDAGFTSTDAADKWRVSESTARRRLKRLRIKGYFEPCQKRQQDSHGVLSTVKAWRRVRR